MAQAACLYNDTASSDYAAATAPAVDLTGQTMTLEAWFKTLPAAATRYLIAKSNATNAGWFLRLGATGRLEFGTGTGAALQLSGAGGATPADGQWHHVACVRSSALMVIYVDGAVWSTTSVSAAAMGASATSALRLGQNSTGGAALGGAFTEVRVWNTARTQAQVLALLGVSAAGTESGLVACWPCNEGSGTTLHDVVASSALTLVNPVWFETMYPPPLATPSAPDGGGGTPTLVAQTDTTGRAVWRQPAAWYVCTVSSYGTAQPSVVLAASHWLPGIGHGLCLGTGDAVRATVALQYGKQEVRPATGTAAALELNVAPDVACHVEAWQLV
jgi:hypothetical protein